MLRLLLAPPAWRFLVCLDGKACGFDELAVVGSGGFQQGVVVERAGERAAPARAAAVIWKDSGAGSKPGTDGLAYGAGHARSRWILQPARARSEPRDCSLVG